MPPTLPTSTVNGQLAPLHEPFIVSCHIPLASQDVRVHGVLVENAVGYCSVSRPACHIAQCTRTNHDITCRLRTILHQVRVRLLLVECRVSRVRRRIVASPCQINCALLRQVHCHVRQIVHDVQTTRDRYHQAQTRFHRIQVMILHSTCRPHHAEQQEQLRQLQLSCCVQTSQQLENTSRLLDRVSHLLLTTLCQLQRPSVVALASPPFHTPRQAAHQPALLAGPENVQHFQVQTEEQARNLVL